MKPSSSSSYDRRAVAAWALYDFANSSFTTLVVTFVYSTFFAKTIAPSEVEGQALWSRGVALSGLAVALLSPYVGALADRGGYRKRLLLLFTAVSILGTIALFFPTSGQVTLALTIFVAANIAYEVGYVFYNAYLPDLAPPEKIGRISGYGWGLGYIGGIFCLVIALVGLVQTDAPLFGFSTAGGENVRAANLLVAAWFALFSIPLFLVLPEVKASASPQSGSLIRSATRQLLNTFHAVRTYRHVFRLLLARLIYNDGLITIFNFGGIYAAGVFGFSFEEIIIFGIALNVAAGLGAFAFGFVDDRIGGKRTILISIVGLFLASLLAVLTTSVTLFWVAGVFVGLLAGPNQSASRSLLGRFTPEHKENEFYGFFAFSGKATSFLGPLLLGLLTDTFASQRAGVAVVLVFFAAGGLILWTVDENEGKAAAQRHTASSATRPQ